MKTLIKNALIDGIEQDLLIEDNLIRKKAKGIEEEDAEIVNAEGKAVIPAFYNMHTHAAMALLRSYSEDKPLFDWLNNIWKREAELTPEDIYNGTRLAILEMIKSGTVFFADMYWFHDAVARAAKDMGMRANVGICFMDSLGEETIQRNFDYAKQFAKDFYATIQNKFHYAITGNTAAEIIYNRVDSQKVNMGLTNWNKFPDRKILKSDVCIAKNYLDEKEIKNNIKGMIICLN